MIVGIDALLVDGLEAGAHGLVSAVADCFPEVMVQIWADWHAGALSLAAERQATPLRECSPDEAVAIRAALEELGVL